MTRRQTSEESSRQKSCWKQISCCFFIFLCVTYPGQAVCVCVPYLSTTCWPPWSPYTAVCSVDGPFGCPTCCEMTLQLLHENEWNYRLTRKFSVKERAVPNQSSAGWVGGRAREGGKVKVEPAKLLCHCGNTMDSFFFFLDREAHPPCP